MKKLLDFLKGYKGIICVLILIVIILLFTTYNTLNMSKTYVFNGYSEHISINNGVISLNNSINLFNGNDITYTGDKDYIIKNYEIGYYLVDGDNLVEFAKCSLSDDKGLSLAGVLNEMSEFIITEPVMNKHFFSMKNISLLENGLVFKISATTKDDKKIEEEINIKVSKISK